MAEVELHVTPGLGDNSYLVVAGDEALVLDPQRDVGRFLDAARRRGARIRHVVETHVHNDYLSGALELREATGATIHAPARGGYAFPFAPVEDGDEVAVGDASLRALATPGHTPEHTSYLLRAGDALEPVAAFTGGSLMVGSAGRTDLLGPERTEELTRAQFRSLARLADLPDAVEVLPTHGAGSFCGSAGSGGERVSTMGRERLANRALLAPDEAAFLATQLDGLLAYPTYYREMGRLNRAGPPLIGIDPPPSPPLDAEVVAARLAAGAWVVDARSRREFAAAHVPGSVNVELDESFASYVGWVVPFGAEVVLVLPGPEAVAAEEAAVQLRRIGYDRVAGFLAGGVSAWRASGRPTGSYPTLDLDELCRQWRDGDAGPILDVRQRSEWDEGHIDGSRFLFVGDLPGRTDEVGSGEPVSVICRSGHRAAIAASLLDRDGIPVRLVPSYGVPRFLTRCAKRGV